MLRIVLCDDEYITLNYYYEHLTRLFKNIGVDCTIDLFTDSGKLLSELYQNKRWDVYFLDIDMPLIDGIGLGKKIRSFDSGSYLIYISIHRERVYESFEARPFRFIPKDEFQNKIEACIHDLIEDCTKENEQDYVFFETKTSQYRYKISDILFIQGMDKYITLELANQGSSESIRYRLSDAEQHLTSNGFIRIHKSYLVNYQYIKSIQPTAVILDDNRKLPISRGRLEEIKTTFRRLTL